MKDLSDRERVQQYTKQLAPMMPQLVAKVIEQAEAGDIEAIQMVKQYDLYARQKQLNNGDKNGA